MYLVRPANIIDLPAIERLTGQYEIHVTTLPSDREKLSELLNRSTLSFNGETDDLERSSFIFVMEDTNTQDVVGVAGLDAYAGGGYPFFNYRIEDLVHASHRLGVHTRIPILYLSHELTGSTVLRSFAIKPELRETSAFDLLSRSRLMFIAQNRSLFGDRVVTEIQGVLDEQGESPFWNSIGRHFFDIDFATADYYVGVKSKTFIAELMPQHPIYVSLLTDAAQQAMNQAHPFTQRTCQLLVNEGFEKGPYIDIFDGGPTLLARTNELLTIKQCKSKEIAVSELVGGNNYLIATGNNQQFRATTGCLTDGLGDYLRVSNELAGLLSVSDGDVISYSNF